MRRIISMALCVMMLTVAVAGCKGSEPAGVSNDNSKTEDDNDPGPSFWVGKYEGKVENNYASPLGNSTFDTTWYIEWNESNQEMRFLCDGLNHFLPYSSDGIYYSDQNQRETTITLSVKDGVPHFHSESSRAGGTTVFDGVKK
ncbi:MAG: hypothetical protein E7232_13985 [Lachnospiraceae bacterium]|nr:hypothetical protein [Lachnospiraceae bacterium]